MAIKLITEASVIISPQGASVAILPWGASVAIMPRGASVAISRRALITEHNLSSAVLLSLIKECRILSIDLVSGWRL